MSEATNSSSHGSSSSSSGTAGTSKPVINSSEYGAIIINNQVFKTHMVIYSTGEIVKANIRHELNSSFVEQYLRNDTEVVIIGTGTSGSVCIFEGVKHLLKERGIQLITAHTPEACFEFNKTPKRAVAFMHITG